MRDKIVQQLEEESPVEFSDEEPQIFRTQRQDDQQLTSRSTDHTSKIPEETLLVIFCLALPPSWAMGSGSSLPPFPQTIWSADYRTKLAIVGVCKIWNHIGLEFLYESVMLQRIGQLVTLVRALEGRAELGAFVRRLEICYFVPRGYHAIHITETKKIFEMCPRLTDFVFNPQGITPPTVVPLPAVGPAITHLEVGDAVEYDLILPVLEQLCETLRSLSLLLPAAYGANHPILVFSHLQSLRLALTAESEVSAVHWVITNLQLVTFRPNWPGMLRNTEYYSIVFAFLHAYGPTLKVLKVLPTMANRRRGSGHEVAQQLLDRCPVLQHFAAPASHLKMPLHHHAVRCLDALSDGISVGLPQTEDVESLDVRFPALRVCRYIDGCHDFVDAPPPLETEKRVVDVVEKPVHYDLPESSWLGFILSDQCLSEPGSSDDSDYVWNSQDDDDGSDVESGTDSSDASEYGSLHGDTSSEDDDWEADRHEALAIFRRTLNG
ncbi:hypothetical protein B0H19DRAFT_1372484 [Mycena capillaripes]|nr:hypothetical protein B0H19DRAFT_1372484 [Mycena capillaripes]